MSNYEAPLNMTELYDRMIMQAIELSGTNQISARRLTETIKTLEDAKKEVHKEDFPEEYL